MPSMLAFMQGFSYGLFMSCLPWLIIGMIDPRLALPTEPASRWRVAMRYWLIIPFISLLIWLTSLWGGLSPALSGWLAGLVAIPIAMPLERRLRQRWQALGEQRRDVQRQRSLARQQAELERRAREEGLMLLDGDRPPEDTDSIISGLWQAKQQLIKARRPDLALQADRIYSRYLRVRDLLRQKFDVRELTFERSNGLVSEVCHGTVDTLRQMASMAIGLSGLDAQHEQGSMGRNDAQMSAIEREALERRQKLLEQTEGQLRELSARNEAAMSALDDMTIAVSAIDTHRPQASVSLEQAIEDLKRFVEKTPHYGKTGH